MKFNVTLDRDEVGMWVVACPSIPGCISQGRTKDEALTSIEEAIALCLEVRAEKGMPSTGIQLADLPVVMASLPHLAEGDAGQFAADLDEALVKQARLKLHDPWDS